MTHYEVLGVRRDATQDDIRRAYLRLARRHHPDRHDGPEARSEEVRMQEINAAWTVLRDPASRARYDRRTFLPKGVTASDVARARAQGPARPAGPARRAATVNRPSRDFRPYHDHDEDDDDSWRYEPDVGDPATRPGRPLTMAPPLLFFLGGALLAVSLVVGARVLVVLGVAALVLSGLLFVGAPVVAMFRSQAHEAGSSRPPRSRG